MRILILYMNSHFFNLLSWKTQVPQESDKQKQGGKGQVETASCELNVRKKTLQRLTENLEIGHRQTDTTTGGHH